MAAAPDAEMPFLDHLEELRWRLFKALGALLVSVVSAFALLVSRRVDIVSLLARPVQPYLDGRPLMVTGPSDLFTIVMQASVGLGLVVASPVIVWQVWGFLSPALYRHEKRVVIPVLIGAALLFLGGVALAYFFALPVTLGFLLSFQSEAVASMLTAERYFSFVFSMCLAFGAVFELPIVILLLTGLGLVNPRMLGRFRRHAFVACLALAALITPGDAVTGLVALTVPLYLLYEVSIWLSMLVFVRRERRLAAA